VSVRRRVPAVSSPRTVDLVSVVVIDEVLMVMLTVQNLAVAGTSAGSEVPRGSRSTRPDRVAVRPASFAAAAVVMNCGQSASVAVVLRAVIRWRALRGLRNKSN